MSFKRKLRAALFDLAETKKDEGQVSLTTTWTVGKTGGDTLIWLPLAEGTGVNQRIAKQVWGKDLDIRLSGHFFLDAGTQPLRGDAPQHVYVNMVTAKFYDDDISSTFSTTSLVFGDFSAVSATTPFEVGDEPSYAAAVVAARIPGIVQNPRAQYPRGAFRIVARSHQELKPVPANFYDLSTGPVQINEYAARAQTQYFNFHQRIPLNHEVFYQGTGLEYPLAPSYQSYLWFTMNPTDSDGGTRSVTGSYSFRSLFRYKDM